MVADDLLSHVSSPAGAAILAAARAELQQLDARLCKLDREIVDRKVLAEMVRERMHFLEDRIAACDHAEPVHG